MPRTLQQVIQEVCAVVGVELPLTSVFAAINNDRTMQEMVSLANAMAQRIAYDTRDWIELRKVAVLTGDAVWTGVPLSSLPADQVWVGGTTNFNLPADYKRLLLTANVRSTINPKQPLRFVPDYDDWLLRRLSSEVAPQGEYTISGGQMLVYPVLHGVKPMIPGPPVVPAVPAQQVQFPYLEKNCIRLNGVAGVHSDVFQNDIDTYRLDDRLLVLGMIWQWKAHKGSPYAEDMGTFSDALAMAMGHDQPAPIIIGRAPASQAQVAYPGVITGPPWPFP